MPVGPNQPGRAGRACKQCMYFVTGVIDAGGAEGECRRYPPTRTNRSKGTFPIIHQDRWCGEFKHVNEVEQVIAALQNS